MIIIGLFDRTEDLLHVEKESFLRLPAMFVRVNKKDNK